MIIVQVCILIETVFKVSDTWLMALLVFNYASDLHEKIMSIMKLRIYFKEMPVYRVYQVQFFA